MGERDRGATERHGQTKGEEEDEKKTKRLTAPLSLSSTFLPALASIRPLSGVNSSDLNDERRTEDGEYFLLLSILFADGHGR